MFLIFGVQKDEEEELNDIFSNALYFSGFKPTRKTQEEGKYILLTITASNYNAQLEIDRLLSKYFNNTNVARCSTILEERSYFQQPFLNLY